MKIVVVIALMLSLCGTASAQKISLTSLPKSHFNLKKGKIEAGDYSGITQINDSVYAIISDKGSIVIIGVKYDKKLEVTHIKSVEVDKNRDIEGVAYFPKHNSLLVSGEGDQRILEYTLDGELTGQEMMIPHEFDKENIVRNGGFESLTYNEHTKQFWTTTEMPLKQDSTLNGEAVRLICFNEDFQPESQWLYPLTEQTMKGRYKLKVHGVSDLLALDDGRLLVVERTVVVKAKYIGSFCETVLYLVNPHESDANSYTSKTQVMSIKTKLKLTDLVSGTRYANYEGICFGPKLNDGSQSVLLICDSQHRKGNALCRLKDEIILYSINTKP